MLSDIKSGVQLVIFLIFFAAGGYFLSQAIPTITQAATLPARIESENVAAQNKVALQKAQVQAEITAVPTMQALIVKATEAAIANEQTKAKAAADAQVVAAQGNADLNRKIGESVFTLIVGLIAVAVLMVATMAGFNVWNQKRHSRALAEVARRGGILELPNGHRVQFGGTPLLTEGESSEVIAKPRQRVKARR